MIKDLWDRAVTESFEDKYFTKSEWKEKFKDVKYGIGVAVLIDIDALPGALVKRSIQEIAQVAINPNFYESK